jgi:hypothetical protein
MSTRSRKIMFLGSRARPVRRYDNLRPPLLLVSRKAQGKEKKGLRQNIFFFENIFFNLPPSSILQVLSSFAALSLSGRTRNTNWKGSTCLPCSKGFAIRVHRSTRPGQHTLGIHIQSHNTKGPSYCKSSCKRPLKTLLLQLIILI